MGGESLVARAVRIATSCPALSRVVVSTDDAEIARVAREAGAEVLDRPPEHAGDEATALSVLRHAVGTFAAEGWSPDVVAYLQPTSPLRRAEHITAGVELLQRSGADAVVSVVEVPHRYHPLSVLRLQGEQVVSYVAGGEAVLRRQDKEVVYARNGPAVLVLTRSAAMEAPSLYAGRVLPLVMDVADSVDVDRPEDLAAVERALAERADG